MALLARYTLRKRTLVDRAMNNAHFDLLSKPFRSPWAKEAVLDASGVLSQMGGGDAFFQPRHLTYLRTTEVR